jgi:ribosomal protein S18 acetylase RimI-like enzyme
VIIRQMREEDADAVREVDAVAFYAWERGVRGEGARLNRRTRTNVLVCREKDPDGCFVAEGPAPSAVEGSGRVVGFIFSRTWGGVGWFGTFGVLPEYQGQGIGQRLIAASLEYLRRDPQRVIGLETMPDSPYNLGLYLRCGFQARLPIFLLSKELERPTAGDADLPRWSSADAGTQERWLADLREATGQIMPRLDYTKEISLTARHRLGETLLLTDGSRAVGLSTVWLVGACESWGQEQASVQALALHPAHTGEEALRAITSASEALARSRGKQKLILPVNARHAWALEQLLRLGYRVERAGVRMVLKGTDDGPATDRRVNCARWAG